MYQTLTYCHSLFRWVVLIMLVYAIWRAYSGIRAKRAFNKTDNSIRHWTATAAHIQLILGILLYIKSPVIKFFFKNTSQALQHTETTFFSLIHSTLMLSAIVIITVGSALTKRKDNDHKKFTTLFIWYLIALFIIFIAIPWPFSPLAARPYIR